MPRAEKLVFELCGFEIPNSFSVNVAVIWFIVRPDVILYAVIVLLNGVTRRSP